VIVQRPSTGYWQKLESFGWQANREARRVSNLSYGYQGSRKLSAMQALPKARWSALDLLAVLIMLAAGFIGPFIDSLKIF
jgi:hypothetical protein